MIFLCSYKVCKKGIKGTKGCKYDILDESRSFLINHTYK